MIPVVDVLYFVGTIAIVTGMGIFIVRSMRSGKSDEDDSAKYD